MNWKQADPAVGHTTSEPFGNSAALRPSWQERRRGGSEGPWLCVAGFRQLCLCRG